MEALGTQPPRPTQKACGRLRRRRPTQPLGGRHGTSRRLTRFLAPADTALGAGRQAHPAAADTPTAPADWPRPTQTLSLLLLCLWTLDKAGKTLPQTQSLTKGSAAKKTVSSNPDAQTSLNLHSVHFVVLCSQCPLRLRLCYVTILLLFGFVHPFRPLVCFLVLLFTILLVKKFHPASLVMF